MFHIRYLTTFLRRLLAAFNILLVFSYHLQRSIVITSYPQETKAFNINGFANNQPLERRLNWKILINGKKY